MGVSSTEVAYRPRLVDALFADAMEAFPAVMVVGPRAVGKTTSAAQVVAQVDRLDSPDVASVYQADPDAALRRASKPLLLDEGQEVPEVLAAVKRAVDRDATPGQFVLTSSVRATTDMSTWAGTGRVVRVAMHPLAEREVAGAVTTADLVSRDVASVDVARDPERLRRYLSALALHLAGQPPDATLMRDADVNARTASAYERALTHLAVLDVVPSWASNRLKRLAKAGKRYLVDTALAAAAAGIDADEILHDGDLRGRWFDAFAAMQVRAELAALAPTRRLHHLRVEGGRHEVDLVVDLGRGRLFGLEFKAGATPSRRDARHLMWLRDELGVQFVGGDVWHTGQAVLELDDRIAAMPLSVLWSRT